MLTPQVVNIFWKIGRNKKLQAYVFLTFFEKNEKRAE